MRILRFAQNDRIGGAAPPADGCEGRDATSSGPAGCLPLKGKALRRVSCALYPGPYTLDPGPTLILNP